jgi:hypothetical protein
MTSRVSTRTSCSALAATSGADVGTAGAAGAGFSALAAAGGAASDPGTGAPGVVADAFGPAVVPAGFGTGLTKTACQTYSTRNARKMARRTRLSI